MMITQAHESSLIVAAAAAATLTEKYYQWTVPPYVAETEILVFLMHVYGKYAINHACYKLRINHQY